MASDEFDAELEGNAIEASVLEEERAEALDRLLSLLRLGTAHSAGKAQLQSSTSCSHTNVQWVCSSARVHPVGCASYAHPQEAAEVPESSISPIASFLNASFVRQQSLMLIRAHSVERFTSSLVLS